MPSRTTESENQNDIMEAHRQTSRLQRTAAHQESAKILKKMNLAAYTSVDKGLFKILSDSSERKAGTTLTGDQDEGAREPMDVQAPKPGHSTVDDGASVSLHI